MTSAAAPSSTMRRRASAPTGSRRTSFTRPSSITSTRVPASERRGRRTRTSSRRETICVREGAAGLDDDPGEGRIGAMAELLEGHAALDRLRRGGLPGLGGRRDARRQLRQALDEKILGDEPGPGAHAHGGIEGDGLTLDDDAGLVADELRAALADGERGARALRAPRALEERGQLLRRDVGATIVDDHAGQPAHRARAAPELDRVRARRRRRKREPAQERHDQQEAKPVVPSPSGEYPPF